jgi:hypothetical protein
MPGEICGFRADRRALGELQFTWGYRPEVGITTVMEDEKRAGRMGCAMCVSHYLSSSIRVNCIEPAICRSPQESDWAPMKSSH